MGKRLLIVVAVAAACLFAAGRVAAEPIWAGECGIAHQETVWGEYGWPSLLPILARPGTLLAVTNNPGADYPAEARALGAATYGFDLHLAKKVGTPSNPADPSTLEAAAEKQYETSVARMGGCTTPLIVENELNGAGTATPWSASYAQYRANVLIYLQDLAALGAHPLLLVSKTPFTASSDAVAWWLAVTKVADIAREVYVPATVVWPLGATLGSRLLRERYRQAVGDFTSIGIPANRLGIMISFLSAKGGGGRNGIKPVSDWYQVVKWEALSAKEVAAELHLGSIFSWGWQEWTKKEADPAKPDAACVWLWARTRSLCNAPKMLGPHFDASLTEGQIDLPHGTVCVLPGHGSISGGDLTRLTALTGDREVALSALYESLVDAAYMPVSAADVRRAERAVIATSFHGSHAAYVAALRQAHASVSLARLVLAEELREARLAEKQPAPAPSGADVSAFYSAYPELLVRRVRVSPQAPWVGGAKNEGLVVSGASPEQLFSAASGRTTRVTTLEGTYKVKPLDASQPLGSLPLSAVRPAIVAALRGFERTQAFERSTISRQRGFLGKATCLLDHLPQPAAVDLTQYLPFLRLS